MAGETSHKIFSAEERTILIDLVKENKIIENKKTDVVSVSKKKAAWEEIERQFNSHSVVSKRTLPQLKKCWDNIKTKRKKNMANEKRQVMKILPRRAASTPPELELAVPHLERNAESWRDSDADAVRSSPGLSSASEAAGSSSKAQDSQCTPVAQGNFPASSSQGQSSANVCNGVDAPLTAQGQTPTPHPPRQCNMRDNRVVEELETRLKRHRLQMEYEAKMQSLREKELELFVEDAKERKENIRKEEERRQALEWEKKRKRKSFESEEERKTKAFEVEEERRKKAFEWEEDRKKKAFEWEEDRKRKAFEAEEKRKEELHLLEVEIRKKQMS